MLYFMKPHVGRNLRSENYVEPALWLVLEQKHLRSISH